MIKIGPPKPTFHGITTLGEKGQAVIPAETRKMLKLKKGEKLLVFAMDNDAILITKISNLKLLAARMAGTLGYIEKVIAKVPKNKL